MWKKRSGPFLYAKSESLQSYNFNSSSEMLMFIAVIGLPWERSTWQVKYLKASSSSFSFYRVSESLGSLNCISELSLKEKKGKGMRLDCSICFAVFLLQIVITLWHDSSQRIKCILKINRHRNYPLYVCSSSVFCWRWLGLRLSTAKFHQGFFSPWISMSWHQSGTPVSKDSGWWGSQGGHRHAPSKGRCWCKAAAGWPILCYWRPAVLPAGSLLVQFIAHSLASIGVC